MRTPAGWHVRSGISKREPWFTQRSGLRSNRVGRRRSSSTVRPTRPQSWPAGGSSLSDPSDAHARQPYHAAAGTARKPGPQLDKLIAAVETFGRQSVTAFIREQEKTGRRFDGAGIVVGSLIDPADIANDHIRIHALEGQLFRGIVKAATDRRQSGVVRLAGTGSLRVRGDFAEAIRIRPSADDERIGAFG